MANIGAHIAEAAACALFAVSIATDLRHRRIPNAVPLLLLAGFALYASVLYRTQYDDGFAGLI